MGRQHSVSAGHFSCFCSVLKTGDPRLWLFVSRPVQQRESVLTTGNELLFLLKHSEKLLRVFLWEKAAGGSLTRAVPRGDNSTCEQTCEHENKSANRNCPVTRHDLRLFSRPDVFFCESAGKISSLTLKPTPAETHLQLVSVKQLLLLVWGQTCVFAAAEQFLMKCWWEAGVWAVLLCSARVGFTYLHWQH